MQKIIAAFICCCCMLSALAQPVINKAEYFIDVDPGMGNATNIPLSPGTDIQNVSFNTDISSLDFGIHVIYIRSKNALGNWSITNSRFFYKPKPTSTGALPNITKAEYFIDTDPGMGNATNIPISSGTDIQNVSFNTDISSLDFGMHVIYIRTKNALDNWSITNSRFFYKPKPTSTGVLPNITKAEYFIDADPGMGNATNIPISSGTDIQNVSFNTDISSLDFGIHVIYIRTKNALGNWSITNSRFFYKPKPTSTDTLPNITQAEYFIDVDPGFGKAKQVIITPGTDISNYLVPVNISGLAFGDHNLFIRSRSANGFSITNAYKFQITDVLPPTIAVNSVDKHTLCSGDNLKVSFDAAGIFNANNIFNVELSGPDGVFAANPPVIGSLPGLNSGIVNCMLPLHATTAGNYHVRISSTSPVINGIPGMDNITINNVPFAPVITAGGSTIICSGQSVTLSSSGADSYSWSNGESTQSIIVTQPGIYTVTIPYNGGCVIPPSEPMEVIVNALPIVSLETFSALCNNDEPVTLSGGSPEEGIYSGNGVDNNGVFNPSISGAGTFNIRYDYTDNNGCSNYAEQPLVVNDCLPTCTADIIVTGPTVLCTGQKDTLTATHGDSYLWSTGATTQSIVVSAGTYTVTVTANGCPAEASTTISSINNNPPSLTYSGAAGFTSNLVNPASATPTTVFRFEVKYTDADGNLPLGTGPKLLLDFEGNGSFNDPYDRLFYMTEKNPNDQDVTDGKDYYFITASFVESPDWKTSIQVTDQAGCSTSFGAFEGPAVLTSPDISIFANDISFSNPRPDTSSQLTVYATVHNNSGHAAENFIVHLVNQYQPTVVYPDIVVPFLSNLPGLNTIKVSWTITTPSEPAWCPMQVFIDYTNTIIEPNELDNQAIRPFTNGNFTLPGDIKITASPNPEIVIVNNNFTVSGVANYRNTAVELTDPTCAGATVSGTLIETGEIAYSYTNSLGEYSLNFRAPATPDIYNIKVQITDYTLDGDTTTQFTAQELVFPPCVGPTLIPSITLSAGTIMLPNYSYDRIILAGQSLTGTVSVTNIGEVATSESSLLQIDLPDGSPVPGPFVVPPLNPGASYSVPLPAMTFNSAGSTYIRASSDYNNVISECSENNYNTKGILVLPPLPDIVAEPGGFSSAYQCQFNSISFGIYNSGGVATGNFNARLTVSHNGNVIEVLNKIVNSIEPLIQSGVSFNFIPAETGIYHFAIQLDYPDAVLELSETNNNASTDIDMMVCLPDLYVQGCNNISVLPVDPTSPGNITINASIINGGLTSVNTPFDVKFNVAGTNYIEVVNSLNVNETKQLSISVPSPAYGNNQLVITADAGNVITESNEENVTTEKLCWDFSLTNKPCGSYMDYFIDPAQYVGRPVQLHAGLYNLGLYEASHAKIRFEVSGPGISGWLNLGEVTSFAGKTCSCPINITMPGLFAFPEEGNYQVRITADFNNEYVECDESNNQIIVSVNVTNRPDYFVKSEYIAPSLLNPDVDQPIDIDITYTNLGNGNGNSFEILTQVDNSPHDSVRVAGVLGGATNTVHMPRQWSSSVRGVHVIRVVLDNDNEVLESNKTNNEATRAIVVGKAPNLKFDHFSLTNLYPELGSTITINSTIKNQGHAGVFATYQLFYVDNNNAEILIREQSISADSLGTIQLSTPWVVVDQRTIILARIVNASPVEYDVTDNETSVEIGKMTLLISSSDEACPQAANGMAKVSINGGLSPYSIVWSNGMTGNSIFVGAGTYNVSVTDAEGKNLLSDSVTINVGVAPLVSFTGLQENYLITDPASTLIGIPAGGTFSGAGVAGNQFIPADAGVGGPYTITYSYISPQGCGVISTRVTSVSSEQGNTYYQDADGDGFGNAEISIVAQTQPVGYVTNNFDCDDNDNTVYPNAPELCDGKDNDCNGFVDDITPPPAPSSSDVTICKYSNASLFATGTGTLSWYDAPVGGNWLFSGGNFITPNLINNTTYYVQDSSCIAGSARTAVNITVNAPVITATASSSVLCAGESLTLAGAGGSSYVWTGNGTINIVDGTPFIPFSTDTYNLLGTDDNGCYDFSSVSVEVSPALLVGSQIIGPVNPCLYSGNGSPLATYTISAVNQSGFTWTIPSGALNVTGQGTNTISFNYPVNFTGGEVSVLISAIAPCTSVNRNLSISKPGTIAPVVSGIVNVCNYVGTGEELTYSVEPDENIQYYTWSVGPMVTLVSGQGTNSIHIKLLPGFTSSPSSKQIRVTSTSECGTSEIGIFYLAAQLPQTAGQITGPTELCSYVGTTLQATYQIGDVTSATSYIWAVPVGATIIGNNTGSSVTVLYSNEFFGGNISVSAVNSCGTSGIRSLVVKRTTPSAPGLISGPNNICSLLPSISHPFGLPGVYSVTSYPGITYIWDTPDGIVIEDHTNTGTEDRITVSFNNNYAGGTIRVSALSQCGISLERILKLSYLIPGSVGGILQVSVGNCPDMTYIYSVASMPTNAVSLEWTVPPGATIISGQGTTTITVVYPNYGISGVISAVGNNGCGNSSKPRTFSVKVAGCAPQDPLVKTNIKLSPPADYTNEKPEVEIYPNPSTSNFRLNAISSNANEVMQVRILDNLGREHEKLQMKSGESITFGSELKAGSYFVEVRQGKFKTVKKVLKL